jgi:hypothetical protein
MWDFNFLTFLMVNSSLRLMTGASFSPSMLAFPCQYYSISVPYMMLVPGQQTGEAWKHPESNGLYEIGERSVVFFFRNPPLGRFRHEFNAHAQGF